MKRIHFIRHGKTEQHSDTGRDFDRKLVAKGINQSNAIGRELLAPSDATVYCSTAARTQETLENIMNHKELESVKKMNELYLCNMRLYLELIGECNSENELMFVGHNFGISDVVAYLTGDRLEMRTGEYIVLDFEVDSWKEISAELGTIAYRYRLPNP